MNESKQTTIELTLPETPDSIVINGEIFYRAKDYGSDPATKLMRRLRGVADLTGTKDTWAAWAIMAAEDIRHCRPITPVP